MIGYIPVWISKKSETPFRWVRRSSVVNPECLITALKVSRWTLSKAFLKSTNLTNKGTFHSIHCSTMFLRGKISSEHLALNPACSSPIHWSTTILIWFRITRQNNLLGIDSKVNPRDLSQTEISPLISKNIQNIQKYYQDYYHGTKHICLFPNDFFFSKK